MNSQIIPRIIEEHTSAFSGSYGWIIFPLGLFIVVSLIGTFPKWPRASWLIPPIWFFLAVSRSRHAPLFAVVAAIAMADIFPHIRWAKWMVARGSKILKLNSRNKDYTFPARHGLVAYSVIILTILLQITSTKVPILGKDWAKLDPGYWPVKLLPELQMIEEKYPVGTPILNDMLFGGFLIFYAPNLRVLIDDRCELYGDEGLLAYINADCRKFEFWSDKFDASLALAQPGSTLDNCLKKSGEWAVVSRTIPATIYQKRMK